MKHGVTKSDFRIEESTNTCMGLVGKRLNHPLALNPSAHRLTPRASLAGFYGMVRELTPRKVGASHPAYYTSQAEWF